MKFIDEADIRVVNARFGIVLSRGGGLLAKMLPVFRLGLGGTLGSGDQYLGWVTLPDAVNAVDYLAHAEEIHGPVNVTSPEPVTNRDIAKALGRALRRPTIARVPEFVLRKALGESAELALGSIRAYPRRLEAAGFRFRYPDIGAGIASALHKTSR